MNRKAIILAVVIIFAISAMAQATDSSYQFEMKKHEDSIAVSKDEKRTVFIITSRSGIGAARVSLISGQWPRDVALCFRFENGRGFANLESIMLTTSRLQVRGALRHSGKLPFYLVDPDGKFGSGTPRAGYLEIPIEKRDDAVEVVLPANLLAGSGKFEIEWIDFYRK
jgi:hypothetical protein